MYSFFRKILFRLDPEISHYLTLKSLKFAYELGLTSLLFPKIKTIPISVMGMTFENGIGLAAGLDKNGEYIDALASLGFGFIEIGTVTPKPQFGNPKPRMFRFAKEKAIINRLGFPSKGAKYVLEQIKKRHYQGILGINIGKNKETPNENAIEDYLYLVETFYCHASYLTINLSSPNTPGLRELQSQDNLKNFFHLLKLKQKELTKKYNKYVPFVLKISPDLTKEEIKSIAAVVIDQSIDGLIATNTTIERPMINTKESGGLSGKPLFEKSTQILRWLNEYLEGKIPLIAAGGIIDQHTAKEKWEAGASLLQLYSGLIFEGPSLITQLIAQTEDHSRHST